MSRIGRKEIVIPAGVTFDIAENNDITVTGPKGTLHMSAHPDMAVKYEAGIVTVARPSDDKNHRALHGLTRSLLANMVTGVTEGFSKTLQINGVGYRAQKQGTDLVMNLGYSHQVIVPETEDIKIDVPNPNTVIIKGADKQKVGQFAAEVRGKRPPEPYKGKGIKYDTERIIHKEGKAGKGAKG